MDNQHSPFNNWGICNDVNMKKDVNARSQKVQIKI